MSIAHQEDLQSQLPKSQSPTQPAEQKPEAITLAEFAHQMIEKQFHRVTKQEKSVLADQDPEHLHQMRVGTRRLRTALEIFETAIEIPKGASSKRIRELAQVLGGVRDLDVQMAELQQNYHPHLSKAEQKRLNKLLATLQEQRTKAFTKMKDFLSQGRYKDLKTAYQSWIETPQYTTIAQFPLHTLLPDLLSPLLAALLMHPGWLIASDQATGEHSLVLHDLRKAFKHARYQAEFFIPFYGEPFEHWIDEVKTLQDQLGGFQDVQVLQELLTTLTKGKEELPELRQLVQQKSQDILGNWDEVRQRYLSAEFRYHLHGLVLQPQIP